MDTNNVCSNCSVAESFIDISKRIEPIYQSDGQLNISTVSKE